VREADAETQHARRVGILGLATEAAQATRSLRAKVKALGASDFSRNAAWFTLLSGLERGVAVVQTILISRALGIAEYGVYGLLFASIGFAASVAGLQMGLTATVFISKYRAAERHKAAAVISIVQRFGWIVGLVFVGGALPWSRHLAALLLGASEYEAVFILGVAFVAASIVSGVQDGIAQGFEMFRYLAKLKITTSVLLLVVIYPLAKTYGLAGVLLTLLGGLALKWLFLRAAVDVRRGEEEVPASGSGISFRRLVSEFALPSAAASLGVGFVAWVGLYWLSRQSSGMESVAVVTAGQQWRGPLLLLATSVGSVAIPRFSRLSIAGQAAQTARFRRALLKVNGLAALSVAAALTVASELILSAYGPGFASGRAAFMLMVWSAVPTVAANVYLQELVGSARMWLQLRVHAPSLLLTSAAFLVLIPRFGGIGYAAALLLGSVVLLLSVVTSSRHEGRAGASLW